MSFRAARAGTQGGWEVQKSRRQEVRRIEKTGRIKISKYEALNPKQYLIKKRDSDWNGRLAVPAGLTA